MKQWYKSKTIWFGIIQGILGVLVAISHTYPEAVAWTAGVSSILTIILRVLTDSAIGNGGTTDTTGK